MPRTHSPKRRWRELHVESEYISGLNNPPSTIETARKIQFRDPVVPKYRRQDLVPEGPRVVTLETAMRSRTSSRAFEDEQIRQGELDGVLRSAFISRDGGRPTPSAGAIYPVTAHMVPIAVLESRACLTLEDHPARGDPYWNMGAPAPEKSKLKELCLGQLLPGTAALLFFSCKFDLLEGKYGLRGYRFGLLEIGHVAQNVALASLSYGLGTHMLGGFVDVAVARLLGLDPDAEPVCYGLALGRVHLENHD